MDPISIDGSVQPGIGPGPRVGPANLHLIGPGPGSGPAPEPSVHGPVSVQVSAQKFEYFLWEIKKILNFSVENYNIKSIFDGN